MNIWIDLAQTNIIRALGSLRNAKRLSQDPILTAKVETVILQVTDILQYIAERTEKKEPS